MIRTIFKGVGVILRVQGFVDPREMLKNFKGLKVWQKSYELCLKKYRTTGEFPKEERYGLSSQTRRSLENPALNP